MRLARIATVAALVLSVGAGACSHNLRGQPEPAPVADLQPGQAMLRINNQSNVTWDVEVTSRGMSFRVGALPPLSYLAWAVDAALIPSTDLRVIARPGGASYIVTRQLSVGAGDVIEMEITPGQELGHARVSH